MNVPSRGRIGPEYMGMKMPSPYFEGQLLVAMPAMPDPRFERSVIYVCAHSEDGAMGIVVNKPLESLSFSELLEQLEIETAQVDERIRVHFGGPVEENSDLDAIDADIAEIIDNAVDRAKAAPKPPVAELLTDVYISY